LGGIYPTSIYKYFRFNEDFKSSLINKYIWFSSKDKLNDPFEFNFKFPDNGKEISSYTNNLVRAILKTIKYKTLNKKGHLSIREVYKLFHEEPSLVHKFLKKDLELNDFKRRGICCFSEVSDEILLWSHYADSHKGIVVEFNTSKLTTSIGEKNPDKKNIAWGRVNYVDEFPEIRLGNIPEEEVHIELAKQFWTKLNNWKYEKEFRIVSTIKGKVNFDTSSITKIILGCKVSKKNVEYISEFMNGIETSSNFEIIKSRLDRENGKILIEKSS